MNWINVNTPPDHSNDVFVKLSDESISVGFWYYNSFEVANAYATYDGCGGIAFSSTPIQWAEIPENF